MKEEKDYIRDITEIRSMMERSSKFRLLSGWAGITALVSKVMEYGIPVMSHDDDTAEKVELLQAFGVSASEFPVSLEAARSASALGMKVFMGAPNMIRGLSSNGHLSASETVRNRLCNGFISDYYPESLLQAPFVAKNQVNIDLAEAFGLVTGGPGEYLKPADMTGRLVEGGCADIIVVRPSCDWAMVEQTWTGGRCVYMAL